MPLRYGLDLDRDYLLDIVFRFNSVLPIITSLTVYPANFYLLIGGPTMNGQIRTAYLVNLVAHIACDWIFTTLVRAYGLPPYGLFYSEGILNYLGFSKRVIMGTLAAGFVMVITTFYILMMRMHQLTVADSTSRWKLSKAVQLVIYFGLAATCVINLVGFVVFGADVDNYSELVKKPELAWLEARGGTIMLFGEPGKDKITFMLISSILFLPLLLFFMAHALLYLRKSGKNAVSTRTQVLTNRLFVTFQMQMRGALIFFIIPLAFLLTTSVIDLSGPIPGPLFAVLRFICVMLLELNAPQLGLVFILRNATHRHILMRRLMKLSFLSKLRKDTIRTNQAAPTWISSEA